VAVAIHTEKIIKTAPLFEREAAFATKFVVYYTLYLLLSQLPEIAKLEFPQTKNLLFWLRT